jgi:phenylpropionate dioxygenase-like ring-hydroxylating dioxygenase large terminal subunit
MRTFLLGIFFIGFFDVVSSYGIIFGNPFYSKMINSINNNVNSINKNDVKITDFPKLNYRDLTEQDKYDLQWYVIGTKSDFSTNKPIKATIWNKNYVVWKNKENEYIALVDACPHKGASLSKGKICNKHIVCPYHGYEFDENGVLDKIPGISFQPSTVYDVSKYKVIERNGWVYLNTFSDIAKFYNSDDTPFIDNIYSEPEATNNSAVVFLEMNFNCYSRILSENSLDIMHIGFVHTFGNKMRPEPIESQPPQQVGINHYKSSYLYEAGRMSFARKVFGVKELRVENEFILPHTTVARILFGDYVSTVVTFALPISENKSKLFVKTYRNFWHNQVGDMLTENWMFNTMLQDKCVIENIDSRFMDGKFNMRFDKLQNTYKTFYKRFIHDFE